MSINSTEAPGELDFILDEFRRLFEKPSTKDLLQSFRDERGGWELWLRNMAVASFPDVYVKRREVFKHLHQYLTAN